MALRVCLGCSCCYAVDLQVCPQCGAPTRNARYDWEDDVAKANAYGSTYYVPEGQPVPDDLPADVRVVGPGAPDEEGGAPSAGNNSSASAGSSGKSSSSGPTSPPAPAPTTEPPSSPPRTDPEPSSGAPSTDGSTQGTGSAPSTPEAAPPPVSAPKAVWVEHAVTTGAVAPEDAEQMTKAEIVETVNGGTDAEAAG